MVEMRGGGYNLEGMLACFKLSLVWEFRSGWWTEVIIV
jgi:hypothetical protein